MACENLVFIVQPHRSTAFDGILGANYVLQWLMCTAGLAEDVHLDICVLHTSVVGPLP